VTELEAIANQDPSNNQARTELSLGYFRFGDVKFSQGRIADALKTHQEALRLREEQYARHSSNLLAVRNYQGSLTRVGEILLAAKQGSAAETNFDHALALGNDLMKQTPSDVYAAADLARSYRGKAMCALRGGRRAEAAELLRQSLRIWRDASKRSPLDVGLAAAVRSCEGTLAGLAEATVSP
jgi:tetratricopeptide (TPR) repeat protein